MYSAHEILAIFNEALSKAQYARQPLNLYAPVEYILSLGGKRIRPVLMLMGYNLYKTQLQDILPNALAIEMYHNHTLLHDDVMDNASVRRGKACVHKVWNNNTAILSGDVMLILANKMMACCDERHRASVMSLFVETCLQITEGQQYDMDFETRNDVTEQEYIEMIRLKTSVLLACSLKIGALLADAPQSDADALYEFGEKLGLAFQLQDDYLDVYGDEATFGKAIGNDILCNKKTYMQINALALANATQRHELEKWIAMQEFVPQEKISAVTQIYNELDIPRLAQEKIRSYFDGALLALEKVQVSDEQKQPLRDLAYQMLNRQS